MCISNNTRHSNGTISSAQIRLLLTEAFDVSKNLKSKPQLVGQEKLPPGLTAKQFVRHYAKHDYHDHSKDEPLGWEEKHLLKESIAQEDQLTKALRRGPPHSFPVKLHLMLDRIEEDGFDCVVSWQPHGRAFILRDQKAFASDVMPRYFSQSKISSFQRQLNLYGFLRISRGPDKGAYYHELFLKHRCFLAQRITRTKVKGTKIKAVSSPNEEPDFYSMPFLDAPLLQSTPVKETAGLAAPVTINSCAHFQQHSMEAGACALSRNNDEPIGLYDMMEVDESDPLDQELLAILSSCEESHETSLSTLTEEDSLSCFNGSSNAVACTSVKDASSDGEILDILFDLDLVVDADLDDLIH